VGRSQELGLRLGLPVLGNPMRIAALVLIGVGFLCAAACTSTTSPDEDCIVSGGRCFRSDDTAGCIGGGVGLGACQTGYTCCSPIFAGNIGPDGALFDAKIPLYDANDGSTDAEASAPKDGASDAVKEGGATDATTKDASTKDASKDVTSN
jgi:hypothetical protein